MTLPFFVLHGEADTVTDPEVSRALNDRAASADRTIKLFSEANITSPCGGAGQPPCSPDIVTPEPSAMILMGSGMIGLVGAGFIRRRRR